MFASMLNESLKQANLMCYTTPLEKRSDLGQNLVRNLENIVSYVESIGEQ